MLGKGEKGGGGAEMEEEKREVKKDEDWYFGMRTREVDGDGGLGWGLQVEDGKVGKC
jgi:hypothetical protein